MSLIFEKNPAGDTEAGRRRGCRIGRIRRIFLLFTVAILFFTTLLYGQEYQGEKLVAANYSDRYHVASCKVAKKIHPDDRVAYKDPEEAFAGGLVPCKKCNPPAPASFKTTSKNF